MVMTIASSTLLLYVHGTLRPRVQHLPPQALAAPRREEPWIMRTSAASTLLLYLHGTWCPTLVLPRERMPEGRGCSAAQKRHSHSYRGTDTMSSPLRKPSGARTRAKIIRCASC